MRKVQIHRFGFIGTFRLRQMLRELRTGLTVVFGLFICMLITMLALDCYVMCENVNVESKRDTKFSYMYTYKYPDEKVPAHGACGDSLPSVKESPINQRFQQFWEKNRCVFLFPKSGY